MLYTKLEFRENMQVSQFKYSEMGFSSSIGFAGKQLEQEDKNCIGQKIVVSSEILESPEAIWLKQTLWGRMYLLN